MEYVARLVIPLPEFLDQFTAAAWGVVRDQAIVVELLFTSRYLFDAKMPPKVINVVQTSAADLDARTLSPAQVQTLSMAASLSANVVIHPN